MCGRDFTSHVSKVWLETPSQTLIRSLVRSLVCFVRPSVSSPEPNFLFSLSLSLPSRARSLVALVLLLSLSRLARPPHLLYFLLLSCFRCYGFVSVSSARLLIFIFFFVFFGPGLSSFVCFDAILVILRTQQRQQQLLSSCAVSVAFTSTSLLSGYPLLGTPSLVCLNSRFVVLVFVKERIQTVFALVSSCLWLNSLCNNSAATAVPLTVVCGVLR